MSLDKAIPCVLAFDLGASSGRAFVGEIVKADGAGGPSQLKITEIHRFSNDPVRIGSHLHWDTLMLFQEIKKGIRKAFQAGFQPQSCGIDTWGVDFGLLDRNGELIGIPYHYRDHQTDGLVEKVSAKIGPERLFRKSGLQFMPFNTLYQLYAMKKAASPKLDIADTLLLTPDLLSYFLTGQKVCEFTMATTTQLYDPGRGAWNLSLMKELGLPLHILPEPIYPGVVIGELTEDVCAELDVPPLKVVAVASHDTESAAAAVPADTDSFAYLVSGTWSLLGTQMAKPLLKPAVMEHQFSNEGGVDGTYHLIKNIMGLWILQECKRKWEQSSKSLSFPQLVKLAEEAEPLRSFIAPDDMRFMNPPDMPEEIRRYCVETGQPVPDTAGRIVRCILESLALRYRQVLEQAENLTGTHFAKLHIVGGGIQNELLCRFTANALGRPVWAGPVEASTIGNLLVQFRSAGMIRDMQEGIALVKGSFPLQVFMPEENDKRGSWDAAYERFLKLS